MTLYALDVHPDGTRIATGGLDSVIRIWNVAPVISKEREEQGEEKCPRLLCTLTSHTGKFPILFSHEFGERADESGRDDKVR